MTRKWLRSSSIGLHKIRRVWKKKDTEEKRYQLSNEIPNQERKLLSMAIETSIVNIDLWETLKEEEYERRQ